MKIDGNTLCKVEGCQNTLGRRGIRKLQLCHMHYMRFRRHGDVNGGAKRISRQGLCSVEGCQDPIASIGLCTAHSQRYYKKGDVMANIPIERKRTPGCPSDGWVTPQGYRQVFFPEHPCANKSGVVNEHVMIMSDYLKRPLLPEETVHHKNGIRDDNRLENLELWSTSQPYGQRVEDKLAWAYEIISRYGPSEHS